MAKAYVLEFSGGDLDAYDRVIEKMGLTDGVAPEGALFHWVTPTDGGLRVTDVWADEDAFQRFAQEQIGPLTAEEGFPPPQVTEYPVHNYIKA